MRTTDLPLRFPVNWVLGFLLTLALAGPATAQPPPVKADEIGGTVTSVNGAEAGVWVIAETTDLATKYSKIVVTDDQGRYLIPGLPKAGYTVWVRGYGLVDGPKAHSTPGQLVDLKASLAPDPKAAAQYYPAIYWYSMLAVPPASDFPGSGVKGIGFYVKGMDGRIDDPNGGWRGRGVWTTWGTRTPFHAEGGKENRPKVVHFQLRPNPLAD